MAAKKVSLQDLVLTTWTCSILQRLFDADGPRRVEGGTQGSLEKS